MAVRVKNLLLLAAFDVVDYAPREYRYSIKDTERCKVGYCSGDYSF
jgi:hypothetical protein